jgi:D-proline reductase (dithiol) PrdB
MNKHYLNLLALSALFIGGCATLPEKIAPSEISDVPYMKWSCEQLSQEHPRLAAALATASDKQRGCRNNDIAGLLFIGLPVGSLTGCISGVSKSMIKSWIKLESPREVPWTPISKLLSDCTVALISTGGIALKSDKPFDQEGEHRNPWWGDPSYRIIPHRTNTANIRVYHMHIDQRPAEKDMNCLLPADRLEELVEMGRVGRAASSHYSFMGYILEPAELLHKSIPSIIERLRQDKVDVAVFIPA